MLVPANAHLPMAHSDADAHYDFSAMAPGTLMLAQRRFNAFQRAPRIQMPFDVLF